MKNKEKPKEIKATDDINSKIIAAMKEGYSQRKAISIAQLKKK